MVPYFTDKTKEQIFVYKKKVDEEIMELPEARNLAAVVQIAVINEF